jgi:hypothetical protein
MCAADRNAFQAIMEFVSSLWGDFVVKRADCERARDVGRNS